MGKKSIWTQSSGNLHQICHRQSSSTIRCIFARRYIELPQLRLWMFRYGYIIHASQRVFGWPHVALHQHPSWYKYIGIIHCKNNGYHQPSPINHFQVPNPTNHHIITTPSLPIIRHQPKGGFVLWISGKHVVLQKDVKLHQPHCSCRHAPPTKMDGMGWIHPGRLIWNFQITHFV